MLRTILLAGLLTGALAAQNGLTDAERADGWELLFDGRSLDGWMWSVNANPPPPCWAVEAGTLRTTPGTGTPVYLLTEASFRDYELRFEWKMEVGANSGVKYRFQGYGGGKGLVETPPAGPGRIEPNGLEYQIIDDMRHADARNRPTHSTAAIYAYVAPDKDEAALPEIWHSSSIVARGLHLEHWLDGRKVVDIDLGSPQAEAVFARSERKNTWPVLLKQARRESPIALQFHDGAVWFRNLKIKRL